MTAPRFSHSIVANDIPSGGKQVHLEADAGERAGLAADLGIPEIAELTADLDVRPARGRAFRIVGSLRAAVVQTCVVTLEPVAQQVAEPIDVTLMRAEDAEREPSKRDTPVDVLEEGSPDVYRNGRIDLGVIVGEHLALGLDPYPRKPEADFSPHLESDPVDAASPFAALQRLKDERR